MSRLVEPEQIRAAAQRLRGVAVRTPLLPAPWLTPAAGDEAPRLKCENLQRGGSFKLRGAYNMIASLPAEDRRRGVITYSSGNHAQGVALAAGLFGVPAVVVMPTTAPAVKVEGARRLGAEIVLEGTTSTERRARAEAIAAERDLTIVPPFDHADIIAGQGTVGMEILEDWPEVDTILVPIGGGGQIAGIAAWVKRARADVRVVGVEPAVSDAMRQSLAAGEPVTIPGASSLADGLLPVRPGDLTFAHAQELVDTVITVSEEQIAEATRRVLHESKLVVEFSGAATVAALFARPAEFRGSRIVAVLSGGNLDPSRLAELAAPDGA